MKKSLPKILRITLCTFSFLLTSASFIFTHNILLKWTSLQLGPSILKTFAAVSLSALIIVLAIFVFTFLFGRFYCSLLCPLGILQDIIAIFNLKKKKAVYYNFKKLRYIIAIASFFILLSGWTLAFTFLDPFSIFSRIDLALINPLLIRLYNLVLPFLFFPSPEIRLDFILIAGLLPFILLTILVIFKKRFFCTSICPVGTLLGLFSKKGLFKLKINENKCISCKKCMKSCPASCIDSKKSKSLNNELCLRCMNCLSLCPTKAISFSTLKNTQKQVKSDLSKRKFLLGTILGITSFATGILAKPNTKTVAKKMGNNFIVPSGAGSRERFLSKCTSCSLCVANCQGGVLKLGGKYHHIHLDFDQGFCEFDCFNCSKVCPTGAIEKHSLMQKRRTRIGLANLDLELCITEIEKTQCGACAEQCPTGALQMVESQGSRIPVFSEEICIGCGACENACPVVPRKAIVIKAVPLQIQAADPVEYFRKKRNESGLDSTPQSDEWAF